MKYLLILFCFVGFGQNPMFQTQAPNGVSASVELAEYAFPTAEGFGRSTTGGKGGSIIHVTSLGSGTGTGTLRWALAQVGATMIVFDIGGQITYDDSDDSIGVKANTTIAGETAPFPGITIKGRALEVRESNVIVRHIRVRTGIDGYTGADSFKVENRTDSYDLENVIFDHCSGSWSNDENWEIANYGTGNSISNVTFQYNINSETLSNYACLVGRRVSNLSIINNLFTGAANRIPETTYGDLTNSFEFNNNIIYNYNRPTNVAWGNGEFDAIGNVYNNGPSSPSDSNFTYHLNEVENASASADDGVIHQSDNLQVGTNSNGMMNASWTTWNQGSRIITDSPYTPTAASGLVSKILTNVGNTINQDAVDARLISEYGSNTGTRNPANETAVGGYPTLTTVTRSAGYDTDDDGIPDTWETANGTNPAVANHNANTFHAFYTDVQMYTFTLTGEWTP